MNRARAWAAGRPAVERVHVTLRDGLLGRAFDARGAVAVKRGEVARLLLLGAGGVTVLDAWITRTRWRLVVPPLGLERRGTCPREGPCVAPPPIGFFRGFFLAPFEGRVLAALADGRAIVQDGAGAVLFRARGDALELDRPATGESVRVDTAASRVRYARRSPPVEVEVESEGAGDGEPDPAAFDDPDAPLR